MDIQPVSPGLYSMENNTYDMGTLLMTLGLERSENIEAQVLDQANGMKKRNRLLEGLSHTLATLRATPKGEKDNSNIIYTYEEDSGCPKDDGSGNYTIKELFEELGMGPLKSEKQFTAEPDWQWGHIERQEAIELIKGKMDSLNSDSQMDMIRLQGLMSKRDTVYQSITNTMKKDEGSKNTIVANYR
jgi:hypothetical protein